MKKSFKDMATRAANAYSGLIDTLSTLGAIPRDDAEKVAQLYIKHKVVKLDYVNAVYNVKHGAFYDKENIRQVANQ